MAYKVEWENEEKTIIRLTYYHKWTWDDVAAASDELDRMLDPLDYQVAVLNTLENENWMPPNYNKNVEEAVLRTHRNMKIIIIVRKTRLFKDYFRSFAATHRVPYNFAFADSVEEALAMLSDGTI